MQKKQESVGLIWFTNNLRVSDNKAIELASKSHDKLIAIYVFDVNIFNKNIFGFKKIEIFRANFLIETITELKNNLQKENITLLTYFDDSKGIIPSICEEYNISDIYIQKEWTSEELTIFKDVKNNLNNNIKVTSVYDQFLYHPEDINIEIKSISNVFSNFRKKVEKYSTIRAESIFTRRDKTNLINNNTVVPSLETLGYKALNKNNNSAFPFNGGEKEALNRINFYFSKSKKLSQYKQTRNGLIGEDYSSKFSPWLANGSLSSKTIYWRIKEYEAEFGANQSTYWLIFELIWRDYFKYISIKHSSSFFKIDGILEKKYEWKTDDRQIQNWIQGKTREPFVNANMIELKETGFMSNRGRQNVASYFSKELMLDWRIGAAYFESMLIDYDVHSNYGNWLYISGVGNDPRDRKFNIKSQAERYDPESKYQNLWLQKNIF